MKKNETTLIVVFVGMGGYEDLPCYRDQNGRYYFDCNNGEGELCLNTGAYLDEACDEICGEPVNDVTARVICKEPYRRSPNAYQYMLLDRIRQDCNYFLGNGNGYEPHLYGGSVEAACNAMEEIFFSLPDSEKPEWISLEDILEYRKEMLAKRAQKYAWH